MRSERLFGLDFTTGTTERGVAEWLLDQPHDGVHAWRLIVTPNVDHLVRYARHPAERRVAERATLLLPDGAPIVWASRLLGHRLERRLTGSGLFGELWPGICAQRRPVVVVPATEEIATALRAEHPAAVFVVPPMFDAADDRAVAGIADEIVGAIEQVAAEFVVLGVAMAKHHRLATELMSRPCPASAPFVLLLGASAEFHVGTIRRAPAWMGRFGLEWLHRLAGDPRRLARRYLVDDMAFFPLVWREWRWQRFRRRAG